MRTFARIKNPKLWFRRRHLDLSDPKRLLDELERKNRELKEAQELLQQLQAQAADKDAEIEALRKISEATGSAFASEEMLQSIAEIGMRITNTEVCHIFLFNESRDELLLRASTGEDRAHIGKLKISVGEGITGWVARERRYVAVPREAYKDHRFKFYPELHEREYESMLAVPLVVHNEVIGVISVRTRKPQQYNKKQVHMLSGIANQLAGVLEHLKRVQQLERQASQISTLSEISRTITSNLYLEEILHLLVHMTAQTLGYKIVTVMLVDEEKGELVLKATQAENNEPSSVAAIKIGESIAGKVVAQNLVKVVRDVKEEPDYPFPDVAHQAGLCSMACVPLRVKDEVIGVLNCYTERPHLFTGEELATLEAVANQAVLAIEHAKLMVRSAILQEMHHRVKNNLQQIASLLRLQMNYAQYKTVEEVIQDSLNRILAIAQVHEMLSREDLDMVSSRKIASSILHNTQQALVPPGKHIHTRVEGIDVLLPLQQATSVALILNELIQNAIEHGFRTLDEGRIEVHVLEADNIVTILVSNDGEPLAAGFEAAKSDSLGLKIVDNLARGSLKGRFTMENRDKQIVATVIFPKPVS